MDQKRQIRFVVAPFLFFVSLWWNGYLSGSDWMFFNINDHSVATIIAVGGAAIPVGFIISAFSVVFLNFIFCIFGKASYEPYVKDSDLISSASDFPNGLVRKEKPVKGCKNKFSFERNLLFASATFDHEILKKGMHEWLMRRWNSFNVSANCIAAIILSHVASKLLKVEIPCTEWRWWLPNLVFGFVLFVQAINSWREVDKMVEFQATRYDLMPRKKRKP